MSHNSFCDRYCLLADADCHEALDIAPDIIGAALIPITCEIQETDSLLVRADFFGDIMIDALNIFGRPYLPASYNEASRITLEDPAQPLSKMAKEEGKSPSCILQPDILALRAFICYSCINP